MKQRAPDPRTARTRAAILTATSELLGGEGASGASIARIAKQANVSVGSVYLHFESKDELVAQLIQLAWERRRSVFDAAREHDAPLDRVFAFGDALLDFARTEPVAFRALRVRAMDPPATSKTSELSLLGAHLAQLQADLGEALERGEIAGGTPRALAVLLFASWSGIAEQIVRRDGLEIDADLAGVVRQLGQSVLTAGLVAPAGAVAT